MDVTREHDSAAETLARELALLLESHKARDVVTLDFRALSMWTDFFVIGTANGAAHMAGLKRHAREFLRREPADAKTRHSAPPAPGKRAAAGEDSGWELIDLGTVVVHVMTQEARDFYELERLWSGAALLKGNG